MPKYVYEIEADTDGFKKGVAEAAKALEKLQAEADAAKPPLTDLEKAKKELAAQTALLNKALKEEKAAAREATKALREEEKATRAEEKAAKAMAKAIEKDAAKAQKELEAATKAATKAMEDEARLARTIRKMIADGKIKQAAAEEKALAKEAREAAKALREEEKAAKALARTLEKDAVKARKAEIKAAKDQVAAEKASTAATKKSAEAQKKAAATRRQAAKESADAWKELSVSVVAGALAAGAAIVALSGQVADARNQIIDMAKRTSITAETLEAMKLATEQSGREFTDLNEILNPFVARLAQVRAGSKEAEDRFKNLGISLRDSKGELVGNDEAFKRLVKTIQSAEDPSERSAIAMEAIGEGGGKLIQVLGDVPLDTFIAQTSQFSIVGDEAAQSAQNWQQSTANLGLVMTSAAANVSDFLNIGPALDQFVVGFVFAGGAVGAITDQITESIGILSRVISGDLIPGTDAWNEAEVALELTLGDVAEAGEKAAFEFIKNDKAIREATAAADSGTAAMGSLGKAHDEAAEAAKEQKQAEQDLAAVFGLAKAAVDSLADSRATATELAVNQSMKDIQAVEAATAKAVASGAERVQAEAAAAVAIQAIRQKLREDVEAIQLEQLEEVELANIDRVSDALSEAQKERADKAKEAADLQIEIANTNRDALIQAVQEVTAATIQGLSDQREAWISSQDERIALMQMESEARLGHAETSDQLLLQELQGREDLSASQQALLAELQAAEEAATVARIASLTNEVNNKDAIIEREVGLLEDLDKDKARLALFDFRRTKAVRAAQVLLTGAQLALSASLPPPAGIGFPAGAIAAGVMTGAQLTIIAAQKAPSFHQGLDDQFQATLQRGEEVATSQGVRNNPGVVGAMNRGEKVAGSGGQAWLVTLDGEEQARSTVQQLDEDGPLRVRISDQSPGMSSGYSRGR